MWERIMAIANAGLVTASDFVPSIGESDWLTVEHEWMSQHWLRQNPPLSRLISDTYGFDEVGVVTKFTVRRVFTDSNTVEILADLGELGGAFTLMRIDADELAIRMEDS